MSAPDFSWVASAQALSAVAQALADGSYCYLDTEFMRERTYYAQLSLIQVHHQGGALLLDACQLEAEQVMPLLLDKTLVFHGGSEDLDVLHSWGGRPVTQALDTQIAAALLGADMQLSYQKLVEQRLGIAVDKSATRSDWLQRPLTEEQLYYAALDVVHLPQVFDSLRQELEQRDRMSWWLEDSQRFVENCNHLEQPERLWRQVKGASTLDGPARRRLQALAAWRDAKARALDRPKGHLIRDADMLVLCSAADPQRAWHQLQVHPSARRRHETEINSLLLAADQGDIPAPLPGMPEGEVKARIRRLKDALQPIAQQLELAPEVLLRRRWLEQWANNPEQLPEPLTGWRAAVVAEPLQKVL